MDYEFYHHHYIKTRADGAITDAFSDGPFAGRPTDGYIRFGTGGYQLRLTVDGVPTGENPPLLEDHGVPVYRYADGKITRRTDEEIEAERAALPPAPPSPMEQLRADVDYVLILTEQS